MTTQEIASAFVKSCQEGKMDEAQRHWSDDVVSIEAFPGPFQVSKGREAVLRKQHAWLSMVTVHSSACEGPFVSGDQFAATFKMDVTMDGKRQNLEEVALYSLVDGKIVEERFMPRMG